MKMIERIARKINPIAFSSNSHTDIALAYSKAKDVLEEMKIPTPDMIEAGTVSCLFITDEAKTIYTAMIDAALKE